MLRKLLVASMAALGVLVSVAAVAAQDFPNKPIRLIVPFPPGGGTDLSARIVAEFLSIRLGQNVVVENKAGAGSQVGLDMVAKAKPDGYTLGWGSSDGLSIIPAVKQTVAYRVPDDFTFIATGVKTSPLVSIHPKLPFRSMADLIAHAKANPGKLRYSTLGVASSGHMVTTLLSKTAGIEMVHIPFSGSSPAIVAAVQGTVDLTVAGMGSVKSFLDSGGVRALATSDKDRNQFAPDVPTLEESGIPVSTILYIGLVAPAGLPEPVLARIAKEMSEMPNDAKVRERIRGIGSEFAYIPGAAFRDIVVKDLERWRDVAKSAGIQIAE